MIFFILRPAISDIRYSHIFNRSLNFKITFNLRPYMFLDEPVVFLLRGLVHVFVLLGED